MYVFWPKRRMCAKNTPLPFVPPRARGLEWKYRFGSVSLSVRSVPVRDAWGGAGGARGCRKGSAACVTRPFWQLPARACVGVQAAWAFPSFPCQAGVAADARAVFWLCSGRTAAPAPLMWLRCCSAVRLSRLLLSELARGYSLGPCFSTAWCGVGVLEPADHTHMLVSPSLGCLLCRE